MNVSNQAAASFRDDDETAGFLVQGPNVIPNHEEEVVVVPSTEDDGAAPTSMAMMSPAAKDSSQTSTTTSNHGGGDTPEVKGAEEGTNNTMVKKNKKEQSKPAVSENGIQTETAVANKLTVVKKFAQFVVASFIITILSIGRAWFRGPTMNTTCDWVVGSFLPAASDYLTLWQVFVVTTKVDQLETKVDRLETKVDRLEEEVKEVKNEVKQIKNEVKQIHAKVDLLQDAREKDQEQL